MPTYQPTPVDTSAVQLPAALTSLLEQLAENTHDVWAKTRISQGWSHGPHRDDAAKQHPGLVPYDDLEESEKEYDRKTAEETLKLIVALGYRILPPS
jgi:RyR domain